MVNKISQIFCNYYTIHIAKKVKEIVKKVIFFTIDKSNKLLKDTKITGNQRFLELLINDSNKYKN